MRTRVRLPLMARGKGGIGRIGRWLFRERAGKGWTQDVLAAKLLELIGIAVQRSWLSQVENGETPGPELLSALIRLFGTEPPAEVPAPETGEGALVAALHAQTEAITALVGELREARERDQDAAAAMVRAAEVLLSAQSLRVAEASIEPVAPSGKTR